MGSLTQRRIQIAFAGLIASLLTYQIVYSLSLLGSTVTPEVYLHRCALALAGFLFPILLGWFSFTYIGGFLFAFFAAMMVFFVGGISKSPVFIWFLIEYAAVCFVLYRLDLVFENQIASIIVDREKIQNERNDLEIQYRTKGEGISILFEKYSTYYNLRKLAEELATTLSVRQLSKKVVDRSLDFIPKGNLALIALASTGEQNMSVVASRRKTKAQKLQNQHGDAFDAWAVKNRRRLIVTDTHQDFRFNVKETVHQESLRSLVVVPLLHEGRVIGTLRINSSKPNVFNNDDLRLLDAIGTLASSALSNAMLYEKTEELAIKDSLTGLYLRRYFYDCLKAEHRRALMTNRPLSMLMCDLDHFKECNDRYGHGVGDLMLTRFSQLLTETSENAFVARYGGEEFAVLLPECALEDAVNLAKRIKENVENFPFVIRREVIRMTVSIGVANMPQDTLDREMLIQKADQALYRAKREGRNRVCSSLS